MQVLIVDDNITILQMIKSLLSKEGILVDIAENGKEAIRLALNLDYNMILMDLQMPEPNGVETTRYIRLKEKRHNNIIAFTAFNDQLTVEDTELFDKVLSKTEIQNLLEHVMHYR